MIARIGFGTALLLAMGTAAQADLSISAKPTHDMSCLAGVCRATAKNANLNVTDLTNMLAAGDTTVRFGGGALAIQVLNGFSWTNTSRLVLDANTSVGFHQAITVAGQGALTITYNDGGSDGDLKFFDSGKIDFWDLSSRLVINGTRYGLVRNLKVLARKVAANPSGLYALAMDYDGAGIKHYKSSPVPTTFDGSLEGLGHRIANLVIRDYDQNASIGLFPRLSNPAVVRDVAIENLKIITGNAASYVGGVAGYADGGTIDGVSVSGSFLVFGTEPSVGGLLGYSEFAQVSRSSSTVKIKVNSLFDNIGGLIGVNYGTVDHSSASGTIASDQSGDGYSGGLIGWNDGSVTSSRSSVAIVREDIYVGGLIGENHGSIDGSFATGAVTQLANGHCDGTVSAGGLAGYNSGAISNSYATGAVAGPMYVCIGGLIGTYVAKKDAVTVSSSYATSNVSEGQGGMGGFIGSGHVGLSVEDGYWDVDTSGTRYAEAGKKQVNGVTGLTDDALKSALPKGFDRKIWGQSPSINNGYPYLLANPPSQ
ncbi:MAG TPA: GLUG motif-containing protein [Rhizomicrobium sp.]|jgi:hypothetical protein|nr:GLUG motif-containing protein [Rhizomicrobium sp.]